MARFFKKHNPFPLMNENKNLTIQHQLLGSNSAYLKSSISIDEITFSQINRICFRGDDRNPQKIFTQGFKPKSVISKELYQLITNYLGRNNTTAGTYTELSQIIQQHHREKGDRWVTPDLIKTFNKESIFYINNWVNEILYGVEKGIINVVDNEDEVRKIVEEPFESKHLIAVSSRFKAAALFPISEYDSMKKEKVSWIYAVHIDKGFDMRMHGILGTLNDQKNHREEIMNIYVDEIITEEILSENIACAVKIRKNQAIDDNGYVFGNYKLENNILTNPYCTLPQPMKEKIIAFIENEIEVNHKAWNLKNTQTDNILPLPESGFSIK